MRRAPCPSRLPIATSNCPICGGRNRGSSDTGIERSASQMKRKGAVAASRPALTAPPFPRCGSRCRTIRGVDAARRSTTSHVRSADPSSTTRISQSHG